MDWCFFFMKMMSVQILVKGSIFLYSEGRCTTQSIGGNLCEFGTDVTKWMLQVNFERDRKNFVLTRVKRKTTLRKMYSRSFLRFVGFSPSLFTEILHMDYCREETRLLFTVARLFRTHRRKSSQVSFSRDLCVALLDQLFHSPLSTFFLEEKNCDKNMQE